MSDRIPYNSPTPNVDVVSAAHGIILAYGRAAAKAWELGESECAVLLPILPNSYEIMDKLKVLVSTFEFVARIEDFGVLDRTPGKEEFITGLRIVCKVDGSKKQEAVPDEQE